MFFSEYSEESIEFVEFESNANEVLNTSAKNKLILEIVPK